MEKSYKTPQYTRNAINRYKQKMKSEQPEKFEELLIMTREKAKEKYDKMKNETPEKYLLNLEKMKIYSKKRREILKTHLKK